MHLSFKHAVVYSVSQTVRRSWSAGVFACRFSRWFFGGSPPAACHPFATHGIFAIQAIPYVAK